ncbi:MAG: hypothetical protein HQM08_10765 [Candidatus Riflebacteria bacterium]|nr:hypothetical protein [Candidatus Riflebacteria bacterium]
MKLKKNVFGRIICFGSFFSALLFFSLSSGDLCQLFALEMGATTSANETFASPSSPINFEQDKTPAPPFLSQEKNQFNFFSTPKTPLSPQSPLTTGVPLSNSTGIPITSPAPFLPPTPSSTVFVPTTFPPPYPSTRLSNHQPLVSTLTPLIPSPLPEQISSLTLSPSQIPPQQTRFQGTIQTPSELTNKSVFSEKSPENRYTIQFLSPSLKHALISIFSTIHGIRDISQSPSDREIFQKLVHLGENCSKLFGFKNFPRMPDFFVKKNEKVIRDRSFGSFEYRHFGEFQVWLDGKIEPLGGFIKLNFQFDSGDSNFLIIKGNLKEKGILTGLIEVEAKASNKNHWIVSLKMNDILLDEDYLPSGGAFKLSLTDSLGKISIIERNFPIKPQIK